jgi:hypothetical protein
MKKLVCIAVFSLVFSVAAIAQDVPASELFLGYSYFRFVPAGSSNDLHGWNIAMDFTKNKNLALVADFTGNYGKYDDSLYRIAGADRSGIRNIKVHSFLFGPKVMIPQGRYTPFIQGLFGVYHINRGGRRTRQTENDFGCGLSFGLDIDATERFSVRPFQAQYVALRSQGMVQQDIRISTGLVVKMGKSY